LQGRLKKYYPKRSEAWIFFYSRLSCPCKHVFVEQRERLTNTFLPALFCAEAHQQMIYTAKIKISKSSLVGIWGDGDFTVSQL
jgi:hypothetical protein